MGASNDRLKQAREDAGYTSARSAAMKFGWPISTYASHENGQTPVPMDKAPKYAKAFKTSAFWILHGIGPRKESIDEMLADQPDEIWDFVRTTAEGAIKMRRS